MGCIKHSMMFEAQMTAISQDSMFPEEKRKRAKCEKKEERTSLVSECGDIVGKHQAPDNVITDKFVKKYHFSWVKKQLNL